MWKKPIVYWYYVALLIYMRSVTIQQLTSVVEAILWLYTAVTQFVVVTEIVGSKNKYVHVRTYIQYPKNWNNIHA